MNNQQKPNKEKQTSNSSSDKKDPKLELSEEEQKVFDTALSILPFLGF